MTGPRPGRPVEPVVNEGNPRLAELATELRRFKEAAGLTYERISALTSRDTSTISRAAQGKQVPTRLVVEAFAKACGGSLDECQRLLELREDARAVSEGRPPADESREVEGIPAPRVTTDPRPNDVPGAEMIPPSEESTRTQNPAAEGTEESEEADASKTGAAAEDGASIAHTSQDQRPSTGEPAAGRVDRDEAHAETETDAKGQTDAEEPVQPGEVQPGEVASAGDRWRGGLVVIAVALVVLLVAGFVWPGWLVSQASAPQRCAGTAIVVAVEDGSACVGRISEAAALPGPLALVFDEMTAENNAVAQQPGQPAVTLAYALPLAATPTSPAPAGTTRAGTGESAVQFAEELDGVVRAVRRANHTATLGVFPKVRVVLYSLGPDDGLWVRALNDLQQQIATDHVVAVAGLGAGLDNAGAFSEALADLGVPVFPSRATADQLTALRADPPALFRTAITDTDLVRAATASLNRNRRVQVVQDVRADNRDAASLGAGVATSIGTDPAAAITYDSSLRPAGTDFSNALAARCPSSPTNPVPAVPSESGRAGGAPDAYFVAGRGPQIAEFLTSLNTSPCRGPVAVLAGPDGAEVLEQLRQARATPAPERSAADQELLNAFDHPKFSFRFLGLAHPDLWSSEAFGPQYIDTVASFSDLLDTPAEESLQGGDTLAGYDAALTAITCARRAASQYRAVVTTSGVRTACTTTLTTDNPIYGAAGPISFNPSAAPTSAPVSVPLVEVRADGSAPATAAGS